MYQYLPPIPRSPFRTHQSLPTPYIPLYTPVSPYSLLYTPFPPCSLFLSILTTPPTPYSPLINTYFLHLHFSLCSTLLPTLYSWFSTSHFQPPLYSSLSSQLSSSLLPTPYSPHYYSLLPTSKSSLPLYSQFLAFPLLPTPHSRLPTFTLHSLFARVTILYSLHPCMTTSFSLSTR